MLYFCFPFPLFLFSNMIKRVFFLFKEFKDKYNHQRNFQEIFHKRTNSKTQWPALSSRLKALLHPSMFQMSGTNLKNVAITHASFTGKGLTEFSNALRNPWHHSRLGSVHSTTKGFSSSYVMENSMCCLITIDTI